MSMTLVEFADAAEKRNLYGMQRPVMQVLMYVPIFSTNGKAILVFAKPGCASSAGALFIVVVTSIGKRHAVLGYYDTVREVYVPSTPVLQSAMFFKGTSQGRYLINGFEPRVNLPVITLHKDMSEHERHAALLYVNSVIIGAYSINTPKLARALLARLRVEENSMPRLEIRQRNERIWAQVVEENATNGRIDVLLQMRRGIRSFVDIGRTLPIECREGPPAFFETR